MEDERRRQDGRDDACVSACEAIDVTVAGEENSTVMVMLRALMTEMDQQMTIICPQLRKRGRQEVKMDEAAQMNVAAGNTQVREEVMATQEPFVLERQLCGVSDLCMTLPGSVMSTMAVRGVVEKLTVSVDDMEEPCLLGLDSLFRNAACDDLGRMKRQVCGEAIPLILEGAVEQVESLVMSSDVEDDRLELHCLVVRGEAVDATEEACVGQAAVSSCGGEVNGGVG